MKISGKDFKAAGDGRPTKTTFDGRAGLRVRRQRGARDGHPVYYGFSRNSKLETQDPKYRGSHQVLISCTTSDTSMA